ncbi:MAG: hypothetical protein KatS3mg117_0027 [Geminicoccaceae bacterium]|jgi:hypothetical protein|nr:MAG: hypothetical protein KatS3mg117_0027 [Geminicoccaceae bacterium]
MPKHPTPAQSAASRANGARSRGPVTAEGLARCRRATARHGLRGRFELLPGEDAATFERLRAAWYRRVRPADAEQAKLVEAQIALVWRRRRLDALEDRLLRALIEGGPPDGLPSLETVCRYRARLAGEQRALERAFAALDAQRGAVAHDGPEPPPAPARSTEASERHDPPEASGPAARPSLHASAAHDRPEEPDPAIGLAPTGRIEEHRHDGPERFSAAGAASSKEDAHDPPEPERGPIAAVEWIDESSGVDPRVRHDRPERGPLVVALRVPKPGWLAGAASSALRLGLGDAGSFPLRSTAGEKAERTQSGASARSSCSRW